MARATPAARPSGALFARWRGGAWPARSRGNSSQTEVDPKDPAFASPTKSIGAFLAKEQAEAEMAEHPEMIFVEDSGRGWRRVVASPEPKKIVEAPWCEADQGNPACLIWRGAVL